MAILTLSQICRPTFYCRWKSAPALRYSGRLIHAQDHSVLPMRLLHTSDWHLGQTLHNFDRTWEHGRFLDWLLDTLVHEEIDALLIAGDIFDNANPSAASQRQLYHF